MSANAVDISLVGISGVLYEAFAMVLLTIGADPCSWIGYADHYPSACRGSVAGTMGGVFQDWLRVDGSMDPHTMSAIIAGT